MNALRVIAQRPICFGGRVFSTCQKQNEYPAVKMRISDSRKKIDSLKMELVFQRIKYVSSGLALCSTLSNRGLAVIAVMSTDHPMTSLCMMGGLFGYGLADGLRKSSEIKEAHQIELARLVIAQECLKNFSEKN